jgi:O-antigen/teichoic acid export membrane protein
MHGAGFAAISFMVSALLGIAGSIITSRLYGVEIIGQLALAMAPSAMLSLLSTVREQPGLVRRIAPLPPRDEQVTGICLAVFAFSAGLTVTVAVPTALITWVLFEGPVGHPELIAPAMVYLAAYVVISNTSWNLDSVLAAYGDGRRLFIVRLHETLVTLALVAALSFHPSVWSPVFAALVGWTTALAHRIVSARAWIVYRASRAAIRAGFAELRDIVMFGLKLTPGGIAAGGSAQAGIWVLGIAAPVSVVGAYSRAFNISARFTEINWRLAEIVFPALVDRHARGDRAGFDSAYVTALRYSTILLLAVAGVVGGAAESIMAFFGPGFGSASSALLLLMLVPLTTTVASLQASALLSLGHPTAVSVIALAGSAVTLVGTVAMATPLGVTGPAVALCVGGALTVVLCALVIRRHVRPPFRALWPYRHRLAPVAGYLAALAAGRAVAAALGGMAGLLPAASAAAVAYVVVIVVAGGGLMAEDRQRLRRGIERIRPRDAGRPAKAPSASG